MNEMPLRFSSTGAGCKYGTIPTELRSHVIVGVVLLLDLLTLNSVDDDPRSLVCSLRYIHHLQDLLLKENIFCLRFLVLIY